MKEQEKQEAEDLKRVLDEVSELADTSDKKHDENIFEVIEDDTDYTLKDRIKNFCKDVIGIALFTGITCFIILKFVFVFAIVPTGSMIPTIQEGDRILVLRYLKYFDFDRGDIMVFDASNTAQEDALFVKRVVGLPGERVKLENGVVYINDEPLEEEYVVNDMLFDMNEIVIPEDSYFVLGDNRANSYDARYWDNKTVAKEDIAGKGVLLKLNK